MSDEAFATSGWIWSVGAETTVQNAVDSMNDINAKIAVIDSSGISKYLETNTNTLAQELIPMIRRRSFYYNIPTTGTK